MAEQDQHRTDADQPRGEHVILVLLDQRRAAHGACILHPERQADREHHHPEHDLVVALLAEQRARGAVDQHRNQDGRERALDVGSAHDDGVAIVKVFMHISKKEQLRRFEERESNPYKRWKITKEDWRNRRKWAAKAARASALSGLAATARAYNSPAASEFLN